MVSRDAPIVCSLDAGALTSRIDEWRSLLGFVTERTRVPNGIRLTFGEGVPVGEIGRLAAAEVACCAFFSFAVTLDAQGAALEVTAPADGQPVLEELFGAAPDPAARVSRRSSESR